MGRGFVVIPKRGILIMPKRCHDSMPALTTMHGSSSDSSPQKKPAVRNDKKNIRTDFEKVKRAANMQPFLDEIPLLG